MGRIWQLFALAHFKPFSDSVPFIDPEIMLKHAYKSFEFSERSQSMLNNWEAVHECQDQ